MSACSITPMLCIILLACLLSGVCLAQTNAEVNAGVQFNFTTPGARSLGLGGAFVGLADDATAAFANPAGLTALPEPEISFEVRNTNYSNESVDRGHVFGPAQGEGFDTVEGVRKVGFEESVQNLSYLSFVYPRKRWAAAVYRHELANFKSSIQSRGLYFENGGRLFPVRANLDIEIENVGLAGAFKVTDNLSLGVGVSFYSFNLDSITSRYDYFRDNENEIRNFTLGGFFGEPDFSDENVVNVQTLEGREEDIGFNVGFLWKMHEKVQAGGVFRRGGAFDFDARNEAGTSREDEGLIFKNDTGVFKVPDVYGFGLALRPTNTITITVDYNFIEYSDLTDDNIDIFVSRTETDSGSQDQLEATRKLVINDAEEIHLGFEYVFPEAKYPIAVRLGVWRDPDHRIRFEGEPGSDAPSRITSALFFSGDDEIHYSFGLGFVVGERFRFDAAIDVSNIVDTASLSGIFRF